MRYRGSSALWCGEHAGAIAKRWVIGIAIGPGTPAHTQPGAGNEAHRMRVHATRGCGLRAYRHAGTSSPLLNAHGSDQ